MSEIYFESSCKLTLVSSPGLRIRRLPTTIVVSSRPPARLRFAPLSWRLLFLPYGRRSLSSRPRLSLIFRLPGEDSNLETQTQILMCYHYTTGQYVITHGYGNLYLFEPLVLLPFPVRMPPVSFSADIL